jgi:YHS domain-containing protein
MKNFKLFKFNILAPIIIVFFSVLLFGCEKENAIQTTKPLLNNSDINKDSTFKLFLSDIQEISATVSNANSEKLLTQDEFELIYNKAINENDVNSKNEISKIMGFSDYSLFWKTRQRILNNIVLLNNKYNFKKLSTTEMESLISNGLANKNSSNINSNGNGKTTFFMNPGCYEAFRNCEDQATATYAMEQVGCVGFGALGWTVIGGALFVACEAAANYHLYVNDRTCRTNFRYCR